jgi:hypothetical protein
MRHHRTDLVKHAIYSLKINLLTLSYPKHRRSKSVGLRSCMSGTRHCLLTRENRSRIRMTPLTCLDACGVLKPWVNGEPAHLPFEDFTRFFLLWQGPTAPIGWWQMGNGVRWSSAADGTHGSSSLMGNGWDWDLLSCYSFTPFCLQLTGIPWKSMRAWFLEIHMMALSIELSLPCTWISTNLLNRSVSQPLRLRFWLCSVLFPSALTKPETFWTQSSLPWLEKATVGHMV